MAIEAGLENVVLYLGSSAAQVWGTLMVFSVLMARERRAEQLREADDIWRQASVWLPEIVEKLTDPNKAPRRKAVFPDWKVIDKTLLTATTNRNSFREVISEITRHQILNSASDKIAISRPEHASPEKLQTMMDDFNSQLGACQQLQPQAHMPFSIGIGAITANLVLLVGNGFLEPGQCKASTFVAILVVVNAVLGVLFVKDATKSLR